MLTTTLIGSKTESIVLSIALTTEKPASVKSDTAPIMSLMGLRTEEVASSTALANLFILSDSFVIVSVIPPRVSLKAVEISVAYVPDGLRVPPVQTGPLLYYVCL